MLMHVYGGITPDNIWHFDFSDVLDLIAAADELLKLKHITG